MKAQRQQDLFEEDGYILVLALLTLLILTLIGIAGLNSSAFESMIAGNDWQSKRTFYKAEGGTEMGIELLEHNFSCGPITSSRMTDAVVVYTPELFHNTSAPPTPYPSAINRDICWPSADPAQPDLADCNAGANADQTNLVVFGDIELTPGSAIQMAAGYEGRGKSAAAGGASYRHQIVARNTLPNASSATVQIEWLHMVGMEDAGTCF